MGHESPSKKNVISKKIVTKQGNETFDVNMPKRKYDI